MALAADQCICLRKLEYSETSQILTLFSRQHGIVRVLAKGAHRRTKAGSGRFDGGIDLLDEGAAVFTSDPAQELATLAEWKLCEGHLDLRKSLRGLYLALYAAEWISLLFEQRDPHADAFDRFQRLLGALPTEQREEIFLAFELDLLRDAGFLPQLQSCASCGSNCGEKGDVYFAPSRGAVVCRNCEGSFPDRLALDARLLRLVQQIQSPTIAASPERLPRLSRHQTDPLNRLFAAHVEYALGRRLRMARYVLGAGGRERPQPAARGA
ncbi:MAG: DNA repair protein RecO [Tepidisphaeraceae bacterium]|jgi:DNA repair protein RecO (recombination protein O)